MMQTRTRRRIVRLFRIDDPGLLCAAFLFPTLALHTGLASVPDEEFYLVISGRHAVDGRPVSMSYGI